MGRAGQRSLWKEKSRSGGGRGAGGMSGRRSLRPLQSKENYLGLADPICLSLKLAVGVKENSCPLSK